MICTRCEFNGKGLSCCLDCKQNPEYRFQHRQYLFDTFDPAQPDTSCSGQCTHLSEEDEDKLRVAMCNLFALKPLELLCLQAIVNGKSLNQFAEELSALVKKNGKGCTRFHAFQLRKSLVAKIPAFQNALLTNGQRKRLKEAKT